MLTNERDFLYTASEPDLLFYDRLLPQDHPLVLILDFIPWESFLPEIESHYDRVHGRPTIPLLIPLKLEFLRYWYNLTDRGVFDRLATDIVFRYFVRLPVRTDLRDHTLLTRFRGHLGSQGYRQIFDRLIAYAREIGLVKDRLRLKDASHVIANIAVPTTLGLFAQLRQRMLDCLRSFDCDAAVGFEIRADQEREQTVSANAVQKLEYRVALVQDILLVLQALAEPPDAATNRFWQQLRETIELAEKILDDQAHPGKGRRTLSIVDEEARRGKHGEWYDGYIVDINMDADSGLITQIDVLEAGGDEAQSAINLVRREQQEHGNQIERLSIDGAGFNGAMIRELEDPDGLNVEVIVPPKRPPVSNQLPNTEFELSDDGQSVTCPAGKQSYYRQRDSNATIFRFKREQCEGCPLLSRCHPKFGKGPFGRSINKSDFAEEYQRVRERAETAAFAEIRREHPAIERKLNELVNQHGGRRAKYWGLEKVRMQQLMTATVVDIKRIIKLITGEVRAELA
jgi:IS5 family transposase